VNEKEEYKKRKASSNHLEAISTQPLDKHKWCLRINSFIYDLMETTDMDGISRFLRISSCRCRLFSSQVNKIIIINIIIKVIIK
jgi:hypothetical protein